MYPSCCPSVSFVGKVGNADSFSSSRKFLLRRPGGSSVADVTAAAVAAVAAFCCWTIKRVTCNSCAMVDGPVGGVAAA